LVIFAEWHFVRDAIFCFRDLPVFMLLDRTQAPDFQLINSVDLPPVRSLTLDNGVPLHVVSVRQQPVVSLELVFEAGAWHEQIPGTAQFAIKMLAEGTTRRSSAQISDYLDGFGAFFELSSGPDRAGLVVYCLTKHLPAVLPVVREMLTEPTFPDKELADLRNISLQSLKVNLEKNSYVANVEFRQRTFGPAHPYGRPQRPEVIAAIDRTAVRAFYDAAIGGRMFQILLAGDVGQAEIDLVNAGLGQLPAQPDLRPAHTEPTVANALPTLVERAEAVQSSIRLGRPLFTRDHPDFIPMLVTNEVLGGYFGSRLMRNIREDKGFTYGISSNLVSFRHAGYFAIGTDVKKEVTQQTLDEIAKEIDILQTDLVSDDELQTVQNYMAGEFVGSVNTPFEIADRYKVILLDGMPTDFLANYIPNLRAVSAETIRNMARRYLAPAGLLEVVVGGK
jgi:zinc protease